MDHLHNYVESVMQVIQIYLDVIARFMQQSLKKHINLYIYQVTSHLAKQFLFHNDTFLKLKLYLCTQKRTIIRHYA